MLFGLINKGFLIDTTLWMNLEGTMLPKRKKKKHKEGRKEEGRKKEGKRKGKSEMK